MSGLGDASASLTPSDVFHCKPTHPQTIGELADTFISIASPDFQHDLPRCATFFASFRIPVVVIILSGRQVFQIADAIVRLARVLVVNFHPGWPSTKKCCGHDRLNFLNGFLIVL